MGETNYRLVFKGKLTPGSDPGAVKQHLAALFKNGPEQIEKLFYGKPVVVKKDLDLAEAKKYKQAFDSSGAISVIQEIRLAEDAAAAAPVQDPEQAIEPQPAPQPRPPEPKPKPPAPPVPAELIPAPAAEAVTCPRCGHAQQGGAECESCGVIFNKWQAHEQMQRQADAKAGAARSIVREHVSLLGHNFAYIAPDIPAEKLSAATASYAELQGMEQPLVLIDCTATGNAKNGLLITDERLYGKNMAQPSKELDLDEIDNVEFKTSALNTLIINGDGFVDLPAEVDMQDLSDMLLRLSGQHRGVAAVEKGPVVEGRSEVFDGYVREIKQMIDDGGWKAARENLKTLLLDHSDDWELYILLARTHLEAGKKKGDMKSALASVRKAIELGASSTIDVATVVAEVLGRNGEAEEGVGWLERAYESLLSRSKREKLEKQIEEYREEHKLGKTWQFFGAHDNVIFETDDIEVIRDKLVAGELPADAGCRRNRVGKPSPIAKSLARKEGRIELLYKPIGYHVKTGGMVVGGILATAAVLLIIGAAFFGAFDAFTDFFKEAGIDWDAMNIWAKIAFVVLLLLTAVMVFTLNFPGLLLLYIIGGTIAAILTQGAFSFEELWGFMMISVLGIPLFIIAAGITLAIVGFIGFGVGYIIGMPIGWIIALVRLSTLPKLPRAAG